MSQECESESELWHGEVLERPTQDLFSLFSPSNLPKRLLPTPMIPLVLIISLHTKGIVYTVCSGAPPFLAAINRSVAVTGRKSRLLLFFLDWR